VTSASNGDIMTPQSERIHLSQMLIGTCDFLHSSSFAQGVA